MSIVLQQILNNKKFRVDIEEIMQEIILEVALINIIATICYAKFFRIATAYFSVHCQVYRSCCII